jgi:hypothetical protein
MESSGLEGGGSVKEESNREDPKFDDDKPKHVGGVNDRLGGVDPQIDETLERLSGGP